jgi:hypothetical protein
MNSITFLRSLVVIPVIGCAILLPGCVVAPYTQPVPMTYNDGIQGAAPIYTPEANYPVVEETPMNDFVYSSAPALVAPVIVEGYGRGYWYGDRFWPYYQGCAFYGGRYYGGYEANYWRPGYGTWHGGNYHYYANRYQTHANYSHAMWARNNSRSVHRESQVSIQNNRYNYGGVNQQAAANTHRNHNAYGTTAPQSHPQQFHVPNTQAYGSQAVVQNNRSTYSGANQQSAVNAHRNHNAFGMTAPQSHPQQFHVPNTQGFSSHQPSPSQQGGVARTPSYGSRPQSTQQPQPHKAPAKKEEKPTQ